MQRHALLAVAVSDPEPALAEPLDPRRQQTRRARERGAHPGAGQHRLARRVKRDQLDRQPGGEDPMRGLGVDGHVELGGRGDVAGHVHGAPHRHHSSNPSERGRVFLERERQVGERA